MEHVAEEETPEQPAADDPEAVEPEAVEPEAVEPEVIEAEVVEPEVVETEPEPAGPDLAALVAELGELMAHARQHADQLIAVNKRQADQIDLLHAENQRLRAGEIGEALGPIVRGLARIGDDVARIRAARPDDEDLAFVDRRVTESLEDAGVQLLRPEPGESFDARLHAAAGAIPTADPASDRLIAEVRRPGLRRGEHLLRPAEVVVHRFTAPRATEPEPEPAPHHQPQEGASA